MKYYEIKDIQEAFDKYVLESGMSGSYLYDDNKRKYNYINDFYNALIVRDIQQKYNIQNLDLIESLTAFMKEKLDLYYKSKMLILRL